jgi:dephospho-CoA kinase
MIHLIVGNIGSGKTTYFNLLKKKLMELFSLSMSGTRLFF